MYVAAFGSMITLHYITLPYPTLPHSWKERTSFYGNGSFSRHQPSHGNPLLFKVGGCCMMRLGGAYAGCRQASKPTPRKPTQSFCLNLDA